MDYRDYYKDLELERNATPDDIKKAFRRLARQYHPDANPNDPTAEERFKKLSEAYEVLSDPERKARYDSVSTQYQSFRTDGGSRGNTSWDAFVNDSYGGTTMDDFFDSLFGGRVRSSQRGARAQRGPAEKHYSVSITLDEAYTGVKKRFTIDGQKVDVSFKPGITSGQKLSIPLSVDGKQIKAILEVEVTPHKHFTVEDRDLHTTATVPLATAVLGGSAHVHTFAGTVNVRIAAGTQSGKVLRLRGQGMPAYGNTADKGDLYVTLTVQIPEHLTDHQRELFEQFVASLENKA